MCRHAPVNDVDDDESLTIDEAIDTATVRIRKIPPPLVALCLRFFNIDPLAYSDTELAELLSEQLHYKTDTDDDALARRGWQAVQSVSRPYRARYQGEC